MKFSTVAILLSTFSSNEAFAPKTFIKGTPKTTSTTVIDAVSNDKYDNGSSTNNIPMNRRGALSKALQTAALVTGTSTTITSSPNMAFANDDNVLTQSVTEAVSTSTDTFLSTPSAPGVVPTVQLGGSKGSSVTVSRTIQGYWQLAGGHGKYNADESIKNMDAHLKAGITTLDTADIYGPSEQIVGRFMKDSGNSQGAIPCTKFCCFRYLEEIDRSEVRDRIKKACERLQVTQLPLVQFFWSNYDIKRYVDVALMLTELKEEGLIKEIGATNFDLPRLKELKKAGVPLVSHQVQLSCIDQRPVQSGMADWCADNDISLIAFGTVGSGILSESYLGRAPPQQEDKKTASMRMYSKTAERYGWKNVQELLQTLDAVAADVRASGRCATANISNIAQRYVLDTTSVASVLVGVRNQKHIEENVRTHSFALTSAERDAITTVMAKRNGPKGDVWDYERGNI